MDEPLSNLDAKLRVQMRAQVARIQRKLDTTTVYVTHDQTEAMTLGDRVAVMLQRRAAAGRLADGALRQPGEPVRRRLHRLSRHELHARDARERRPPICRWSTCRCRPRPSSGSGATAAPGRDRGHPPRGLRGRHQGRARRARPAGSTFKANFDLVEAMGAEYYAHFGIDAKEIVASEELQELRDDAGGVEETTEAGDTVARGAAEPEEPRPRGRAGGAVARRHEAALLRRAVGRGPHLRGVEPPEIR